MKASLLVCNFAECWYARRCKVESLAKDNGRTCACIRHVYRGFEGTLYMKAGICTLCIRTLGTPTVRVCTVDIRTDGIITVCIRTLGSYSIWKNFLTPLTKANNFLPEFFRRAAAA